MSKAWWEKAVTVKRDMDLDKNSVKLPKFTFKIYWKNNEGRSWQERGGRFINGRYKFEARMKSPGLPSSKNSSPTLKSHPKWKPAVIDIWEVAGRPREAAIFLELRSRYN